MSKWMKVDPATLRAGDEVRWVMAITGGRVIREVAVREVGPRSIRLGLTYIAPGNGTWFVRKPKKAKPEPDLVEGHNAKHWHGRFHTQLAHNHELERINGSHRRHLRESEKEVKDARKDAQYWQNKYAVLAASANDLPEKPKPLTRPDEPPVGSFFRVDRTGVEYVRVEKYGLRQYFLVAGLGHWAWDDITEPGDTWTLLELREVGK